MIRSDRGVALATLVIAVIVMVTITGTIAYTSLESIKVRKLDDMYNDIKLLKQKVTSYYMDNGKLPVDDTKPIIQSENYNIVSMIETENQPKNPNDNEIYYIIELEKLSGVTLKYGKDYKDCYNEENGTILEGKEDVYIVNGLTHTIYYVKGIEIELEGTNKIIKKHRLEENFSPLIENPILVNSLEIEQGQSAQINVGETLALTAIISPDDAAITNATWSSSDENIASVDETGIVTGNAIGGPVTITAKAGGKKATIDITVGVPVSSVEISSDNNTINVANTLELTATVLPEDASDKTVTWSSSNTEVATVDETTGIVTGVAKGTATIRATASGKTGIFVVTVKVPVDTVTITGENTVNVGERLQLSATVLPTNANNKLVTWSSGDETIATVDGLGKVTGVAGGTVTITAEADGKSDTHEIVVTK